MSGRGTNWNSVRCDELPLQRQLTKKTPRTGNRREFLRVQNFGGERFLLGVLLPFNIAVGSGVNIYLFRLDARGGSAPIPSRLLIRKLRQVGFSVGGSKLVYHCRVNTVEQESRFYLCNLP